LATASLEIPPVLSDQNHEGRLMRQIGRSAGDGIGTRTARLPRRRAFWVVAALFPACAQSQLDPGRPITQLRHDV